MCVGGGGAGGRRGGHCQNWPEVIKPFSCSTQLSMKFSLIINIKIFGQLKDNWYTFRGRTARGYKSFFMLNSAEHEIFSAN